MSKSLVPFMAQDRYRGTPNMLFRISQSYKVYWGRGTPQMLYMISKSYKVYGGAHFLYRIVKSYKAYWGQKYPPYTL